MKYLYAFVCMLLLFLGCTTDNGFSDPLKDIIVGQWIVEPQDSVEITVSFYRDETMEMSSTSSDLYIFGSYSIIDDSSILISYVVGDSQEEFTTQLKYVDYIGSTMSIYVTGLPMYEKQKLLMTRI